MKRILIIDADLKVCAALAKAFAGTEYRVITESNGFLAIELIRIAGVELVICGTNTEGLDGFELLSIIKKHYPKIIRVIMSGNDEQATAFKAIMQNLARFYILKSWENAKLLEYVGRIFETEEVLRSKDLMLLINGVEKLPTIETSYQKILRMIEKEASTTAISEEIEKDFAISTKLLQLANSAYYGLQTGSVKHATVYLGLSNLKSLIYSTSIMNSLDNVSYATKDSITELWDHALLTSKLLHFIYEEMLTKKIPEVAYSAGLLHNIGSLILIENRIEDYAQIVSTAKSKEYDLLELERDVFHVTHQEAGGYLVSWWELPFPIVEAALYHHRPLEPNVINKEIVCAVHLAQHYAWQLLKQPATTTFFPETFDVLGIQRTGFEAAVNWSKWH